MSRVLYEQPVRTEPTSHADVRVTVTQRVSVNPWASIQTPERSYGAPRAYGVGARRAVVRYTDVLRRLAAS